MKANKEFINAARQEGETFNQAASRLWKSSADFRSTFEAGGTVELINPDGGKVFGKLSQEALEIESKTALYGGNRISLDPTKTTTLTGTLDDVNKVANRGKVALERGVAVTLQGENPGGINILRSQKWNEIKAKHIELEASNPELYWKTVTDEFWETVNKPWLDEAINRGDPIRFVSNPENDLATYVTNKKGTDFILDSKNQKIRSIFGREVDYLKEKGYRFLPDGTAVKP